MNTRYIDYILAIAKRKNMTKAAEDLYVSQSSLSQFLSKLEQEIGTQLFYRTKRELVPTEAGELYIQACKEILEIKNNLYNQIHDLDNAGNIAVGVTSQFGLRMITDIVPVFKEKYPNINITISKDNLPLVKKMLTEETIDLAIIADTEVIPSYADYTDILRKEEVFFAVPRCYEFSKRHLNNEVTVRELTKEFVNIDVLMSKDGSSLKKVYENLFGNDLQLKVLLRTNSVPTVICMIAAGRGVSFVAESCRREEDKIKYYSFSPKAYRLNLLVRRKSWNLKEPENEFCDLVRNYFKKHNETPFLA